MLIIFTHIVIVCQKKKIRKADKTSWDFFDGVIKGIIKFFYETLFV